jgi:PilZ domain
MSEKRLFQRIRFAVTTEVDINGVRYETRLVDISLKGALLEFPHEETVDKGLPCHLIIHLDMSDVTLSFTGVVAHSHDNLTGIKFITIDIDSMIHLRSLLELNSGDPDLVKSELNAFGSTE